MSKLTPYNDRYCPIFKDNIDGELCYEVAMCMQGFLKYHLYLNTQKLYCL